ncbi:hypothetical protein [Candidatus Tisiphia endosymbiont of Nemotelus uliginosus]|uniref:hypothetical protein n=1 Tax=Candidatus Tisiphia endosymbiont of Nemotelus uliginosus TaxID=3077926 RepID=UPI0035C8C929
MTVSQGLHTPADAPEHVADLMKKIYELAGQETTKLLSSELGSSESGSLKSKNSKLLKLQTDLHNGGWVWKGGSHFERIHKEVSSSEQDNLGEDITRDEQDKGTVDDNGLKDPGQEDSNLSRGEGVVETNEGEIMGEPIPPPPTGGMQFHGGANGGHILDMTTSNPAMPHIGNEGMDSGATSGAAALMTGAIWGSSLLLPISGYIIGVGTVALFWSMWKICNWWIDRGIASPDSGEEKTYYGVDDSNCSSTQDYEEQEVERLGGSPSYSESEGEEF